MVSLTPVTVTVCVALQFAGVKVRLDTLTVPSVMSLLTTGTLTVARGWLTSETWNVTVPPASLVVMPLCAEITRSASSLSALVRPTMRAATAL